MEFDKVSKHMVDEGRNENWGVWEMKGANVLWEIRERTGR